jgi:hypothetical protein
MLQALKLQTDCVYAMPERSTRTLYRPLGAFRFFLALLVLFQHNMQLLAENDRIFFRHAGLGILAVAVFFVISGFIVAEANDTFYRGRPVRFMTNRVLRIVPPYLAALFVSFLVYTYLFSSNRLFLWDEPLIGSPWQPKLLLSGILDIVPFFHPRFLTHQDFEFIPFASSSHFICSLSRPTGPFPAACPTGRRLGSPAHFSFWLMFCFWGFCPLMKLCRSSLGIFPFSCSAFAFIGCRATAAQ